MQVKHTLYEEKNFKQLGRIERKPMARKELKDTNEGGAKGKIKNYMAYTNTMYTALLYRILLFYIKTQVVKQYGHSLCMNDKRLVRKVFQETLFGKESSPYIRRIKEWIADQEDIRRAGIHFVKDQLQWALMLVQDKNHLSL